MNKSITTRKALELNRRQQKVSTYLQEQQENKKRSGTPDIHPSSSLGSNKKGLPFATQQAILSNVSRYRGLDDFVRETCDKNPRVFGEKNSKLRRACQDKRRHFLEIYHNNPSRFVQLCAEFEGRIKEVILRKSNKEPPAKRCDSSGSSDSSSGSFSSESTAVSIVNVVAAPSSSKVTKSEAKRNEQVETTMSHRKVRMITSGGAYGKHLILRTFCITLHI
jgi:hypothetical protein